MRATKPSCFPFTELRLTILGEPATKNTSPRIWRKQSGARFVVPSARTVSWTDSAVMQIRSEMPRGWLPTTFDVHVCALIYRARAIGDLDNFEKAIGDALQRGGVIKNDSQIESWDGTRKRIDRANPRVEIVIRPFVDVAR